MLDEGFDKSKYGLNSVKRPPANRLDKCVGRRLNPESEAWKSFSSSNIDRPFAPRKEADFPATVLCGLV
jgi:hypothetical protein